MPTVQQNSATEGIVTFRSQGAGACVSNEALAEIASALLVQMPSAAPIAPLILSTDPNNLAQLDAANALLVPGILVYSNTLSLAAGDNTPLIFSGWSNSIDATIAFLEVVLLIDPTETGVLAFTGGTAFIWPQMFVTKRISSEIDIIVKNFTKTVSVTLRLAQLPNPPNQS